MIKVDLNEWVEFSRRQLSTNYSSKDGKLTLKLSSAKAKGSKEMYENEKRLSDVVFDCGILTPKAVDVAYTDAGEYGIIYETVPGKISLARNAEKNLEESIELFAAAAKKFNSVEYNGNDLPDVHEIIRKNIEKCPVFNDEQRKVLLMVLERTPKTKTLLHGDMQPGNFIIDSEKNAYAIDLATIGVGNSIFDTAFIYFFSHVLPPEINEPVMHMKHDTQMYFWKEYIKRYMGFKNDDEVIAFDEICKKYSFLCMLRMYDFINMDTDIEKGLKYLYEDYYKEEIALVRCK